MVVEEQVRQANRDALSFLCCFVVVVAVVVVVRVVVVAFVWVHMNIFYHYCLLSINKNGRNIEFWRIYAFQMEGWTDGRTDRRTDKPSYRDAWTHLKMRTHPIRIEQNPPLKPLPESPNLSLRGFNHTSI